MSRITIAIGFYFEKQHYAQMIGYVPRSEVEKIRQLKMLLDKGFKKDQSNIQVKAAQDPVEEVSQNQEDIDINNAQGGMDIEFQDNQMNEQNGINELNEVNQVNEENDINDMDIEELDEQIFLDNDSSESLSSLSKSQIQRVTVSRTQRLKGQNKDLLQLPIKRPRKSNRTFNEADEIIRKEEKQKKRKQYIKKQIQAQEKATLQKILNETGRKLKQREEKEHRQEAERENKVFRSLGNVPKTTTLLTSQGCFVFLNRTQLFDRLMLTPPNPKNKNMCSLCQKNSAKYRLKNSFSFACSLPCFRFLCDN